MAQSMSATVDPEKILRDLRDLWNDLGKEKETAGGVLRACSMTLLVASQCHGDRDDDAEDARRTLGTLMHDHPSRAIVIQARPGMELAARVFAECWMPFGRHQQICAEGIEITADPGEMKDVAQLVVPLRVPDLPVVIWFCTPGVFEMNASAEGKSATTTDYEPLFRLGEKLIFDSAKVNDPQAGLEFLRGLKSRGFRVADLAWTRITGWREAVAHMFEERAFRPGDIASVTITHGGESPSSGALYFAAWMKSCVPGIKVDLRADGGQRGLRSVAFQGNCQDCSVTLIDGASVQVRSSGRSYLSPLPPVTSEALMREELSILGPDPIFDRVLG